MTIAECNWPVPSNINRICAEKGIKKTFVAQKANLSKSEFSAILRGTRLIKMNEVSAFADALSVDVNSLFENPKEVTG